MYCVDISGIMAYGLNKNYVGKVTGKESQVIEPGERIAQFVLQKVPKIKWIPKEEIDTNTDRGEGVYQPFYGHLELCGSGSLLERAIHKLFVLFGKLRGD